MTEGNCTSDSPKSPGPDGPTHYSRYDPQPVTVIERWGLGFHAGNVLKYIVRAPHKGTEIRDLRKARWYLDRLIALKEAEAEGQPAPPPRPQA